MEKMFHKKSNAIVYVYKIFENGNALIYSPEKAGQTNGENGWEKVKIGSLVPVEYYEEHYKDKHFLSQTKLNKVARRLKLAQAVWETTDGTTFTDKKEAIDYELTLIEGETQDTNE